MPSYAVVGASRGIGLEYVRQLASRSDAVVFAVVRNPESSVHLRDVAAGLKNIHIIAADVADHGTLERAANQVSEITNGTLDCLIHNAADMNLKTLFKGFDDYASMEELDNEFISAARNQASLFKVNSLGTVHSITAFLPLLRASTTKKIVVIGSGAADPKANQILGIANMAAYGMTKAAALIATTKFAIKLQDEGFVVITIAPGMVDTSATAGADREALAEVLATFTASKNGLQPVAQTPAGSVRAQLNVIDRLEASQNGSFISTSSI